MKLKRKRIDKVSNSELASRLKLRFGEKCEWLEEESRKDPSLKSDLATLNDLINIFGIKKFYAIQADLKNWSSRVKQMGKNFVCVDCGKSYTTELGCKYHVNGKCTKNIAKYKCFLCQYDVLETSKIECKSESQLEAAFLYFWQITFGQITWKKTLAPFNPAALFAQNFGHLTKTVS